jgi:S-DNA-T family DNA segregation ATPase FtsK/SpoIIIE
MSKLGVRNIDGFNARVEQARPRARPSAHRADRLRPETGEAIYETEEELT